METGIKGRERTTGEMDDRRMRHLMEFIVERRAQFRIGMAELEVETAQLKAIVADVVKPVYRREVQAEADREEIREAINKLIIANEVTRKLAEDVARLTMQNSRRVTRLESNQ